MTQSGLIFPIWDHSRMGARKLGSAMKFCALIFTVGRAAVAISNVAEVRDIITGSVGYSDTLWTREKCHCKQLSL